MTNAYLLAGTGAGDPVRERSSATSSNPVATRTSLLLVVFRMKAQAFFQMRDGEESYIASRDAIVARLQSRHESVFLTEFLRVAASSSNVDRLAIAVDILSSLEGGVALAFAKEYALADVCNRGFNAAKPWQPNTDFWYILLRSAAKCTAPLNDREEFILRFVGSHDKLGFDMLEGIIEALGDLATPSAKDALASIAAENCSQAAKELARDIADDLS